MKNKMIIMTMLIGVLLFVSCEEATNYDEQFNQIKDMEIKKAIELVNEWKFSKSEIKSFITTEELTVTFPDKRKIDIGLPENEMYVAIAPYIESTHTCSTHYPSSCQGEMTEENFDIKIKEKDGETIFEDEKVTLKNGFFEIWIPRDKELIVSIEKDQRSAEVSLITGGESKTCITTTKMTK
jgi:Periplasmic copper-binding protein CueP